jgi:hypothetical protein
MSFIRVSKASSKKKKKLRNTDRENRGMITQALSWREGKMKER